MMTCLTAKTLLTLTASGKLAACDGAEHMVLAHMMGWECHVHSVLYSMLWLLVLSHNVHYTATFP